MKYVDKFPDMKYIDEERDGVIRGRTQRPCCVCGWETEFVEINYEAPFCSEECVAEMDRRSYTESVDTTKIYR